MPENLNEAKKAVMADVLSGNWGDFVWMRNLSGVQKMAAEAAEQIIYSTGFLGANVNAAVTDATGSDIKSHLLKALENAKNQPKPEQEQEIAKQKPFAEVFSGVAKIVIAAVGAPVKTLARFFEKTEQEQEKKPEEDKQIQPQIMQENLARLAPDLQQAVLSLSTTLKNIGFAAPQKIEILEEKAEEKEKEKGEKQDIQPMSLGMDIGKTPIGKALDDSEISYSNQKASTQKGIAEASSVLIQAGVTLDDSAIPASWSSRIHAEKQQSPALAR